MESNSCNISKVLVSFFVCLLQIYSYFMICYTRLCCHASKRTWPSIPDYSVTIYVKRTHKTKTKWTEKKKKKKTTKNFQNLLTLEGSFSINNLSKNTLHLHYSFLMPQKITWPHVCKISKFHYLSPIFKIIFLQISYVLLLIPLFPTQFLCKFYHTILVQFSWPHLNSS